MAEKCEKSVDTAEKRAIPIGRIALSALTGLVALVIFLGAYGYLSMRPTAETAERAGVYALRAAASDGIAADPTGLAELTLELNADGTCRVHTGDDARGGLWKCDGGDMTLVCCAARLRGDFEGDTLTLENAFSTGATLTLTRAVEGGGEDAAPVGQFGLIAIDDNGREYSGGVIDGTECAEWYINLKQSGEGRARIFSDTPESVRVDGGCIILRSMRLDYTLDGGKLTLAYPGGVTLFFESRAESK